VWDLPKFGVNKGGEYITIDCIHLKNMKLYAWRGAKSILAKSNKLMGEGNWKVVKIKTLFHVLSHGHPMLEYESLYEMFVSLGISKSPTMYWFNNVSWI
jgi:hypothetical protein